MENSDSDRIDNLPTYESGNVPQALDRTQSMNRVILDASIQRRLLQETTLWMVCNKKYNKNCIKFVSQYVILILITITCITQLLLKDIGDESLDFYRSILSLIIGLILPAPSMK
jgi:hypothetical protein